MFRAGTFYQGDKWVFWDVRHPENAIVVELRDERYAKLIVEVADLEAAIGLLNKAIARTPTTAADRGRPDGG